MKPALAMAMLIALAAVGWTAAAPTASAAPAPPATPAAPVTPAAPAPLVTPPAPPVNAATGYSASALYNLANANARAGKIGLAVLNYERARLLDPRDPDIDANLRFIRQRSGLPQEPRGVFEQIAAGAADSSVLFWIGAASIVVVGATTLARRRYRARRGTLGALRWLGVLGLAAAACNAAGLWPAMNRGVVIVHSAPVHVSPVSIGDPLFSLPEAQEVKIRAVREGFILIETPEGQVGWAAASDVAPVVHGGP